MATRTVFRPGGRQELARSSQVRGDMDSVGEQVADAAREDAPRLTGAGAASIHHEVVDGDDGAPRVRVSWDQQHDYLLFSELGDERQPARPFLRPALNRRYTP